MKNLLLPFQRNYEDLEISISYRNWSNLELIIVKIYFLATYISQLFFSQELRHKTCTLIHLDLHFVTNNPIHHQETISYRCSKEQTNESLSKDKPYYAYRTKKMGKKVKLMKKGLVFESGHKGHIQNFFTLPTNLPSH